MTWTTGKSVLLADGQEQTQVLLTDAAGKLLYEDHLSHPAGDLSSLVARVVQLDERLTAKTQPVVLIAAGTVIDLTPVPAKAVAIPTQDDVDRQAFLEAMRAELQQRTLAALSPETQKMFRPEWIEDVPT